MGQIDRYDNQEYKLILPSPGIYVDKKIDRQIFNKKNNDNLNRKNIFDVKKRLESFTKAQGQVAGREHLLRQVYR